MEIDHEQNSASLKRLEGLIGAEAELGAPGPSVSGATPEVIDLGERPVTESYRREIAAIHSAQMPLIDNTRRLAGSV